MREAQRKKDLELAEKTKLVDEKLASVAKLEQENANLKAALGKKKDLEAFLNGLAKKLFLMLEGKSLCKDDHRVKAMVEWKNHDWK